ncbi:MAG: FAD-dependent oxidoreductase [Rhodospirillaceae bacterium]|jgi:NADPH-dependent 2,4-dienoyl-CoA reductase/sulfur reductase-like enzyme|nr:FAD-dependent oxidoreductase [Rhodospirillaceae bacterium]MBT6116430.1 FAD-dependent oxidoreductase [Rhodospirillaceae bacterium]
MSAQWDLAVIGAGPAGMTAAMTAARLGLKVGLLDEQPRPGGQIYRNPAQPTPEVLEALGEDYAHGMKLIERFRAADIDYRPGATVWDVTADGEIAFLRDGVAGEIRARHVLLATGAIERPVPVPGWTLPGAMTVGAAQILLKTGGYVPDHPAVLVGGGPLLYLVAWQYLKAGAQIGAILETVPRSNLWSALPHAPGMLRQGRLLAKGRRWLRDLRAARVRRIRGVTDVRIEGDGAAEAVSFQARGRRQTIQTPLVLLHEGVIPNTHVSLALGLEHGWNDVQQWWQPRLDEWGRADKTGFSVAGDGAGIWGAEAAEHLGLLAAHGAAMALGGDSLDQTGVAEARTALNAAAGARAFLDRFYRPARSQRVPAADDTIACRCEEVTAGQVRHAARLGALGLTQAKAYTRCGMGPCQGRLCAPTVSALIAETRGLDDADVPAYRPRPPFKPVTLGALAAPAFRAKAG